MWRIQGHDYSDDAEKLHLRNDLLITMGVQPICSVARMVLDQID